MSQSLSVIIVEKLGNLKPLSIKEFKLEDLYKKCGFKKGEDFLKQVEWNTKIEGKKYCIEVFGKTDGRPNSENKYDFPPPIDTKLFFGNCVIIAQIKDESKGKIYTDLSISLWDKIYEKLFGGFEDLSSTAKEDEEEEDELANVPEKMKTKEGYLKDGFVVDGSSDDYDDDDDDDYETDSGSDSDEEDDESNGEESNEIILEDVDSELSEESYDYDIQKPKK